MMMMMLSIIIIIVVMSPIKPATTQMWLSTALNTKRSACTASKQRTPQLYELGLALFTHSAKFLRTNTTVILQDQRTSHISPVLSCSL
jgi:hypothetical protein